LEDVELQMRSFEESSVVLRAKYKLNYNQIITTSDLPPAPDSLKPDASSSLLHPVTATHKH
jgi:hypothetical protein